MTVFDLPNVAHLAETFITNNKRLSYTIRKLEEDDRHILYLATNLFSCLYCQVTLDIDLIRGWATLQETLFREARNVANRYLVYVIPESQIKRNGLYEELARAERDDNFFRKIFIGIPDRASKQSVQTALADRIPLWFEDRTETVAENVPVLSDIIPDPDLLKILLEKQPSMVIKTIEKEPNLAYLLESQVQSPREGSGLREGTQLEGLHRRGTRITRLTIENFRRFDEVSIDLDGDVVLIYGRNGMGKTTICDALELSLFPGLRRLQWDPDITEIPNYEPLIRAGSTRGYAQIRIDGSKSKAFSLETKVTKTVIQRTLDGSSESQEGVVTFLTGNADVQKEGIVDILRYTHFLGQHSIRDFIYGSRESSHQITTTRYNLLAEMFGFGEVEQLKNRITKVLSQVQRKVTEADHRKDDAKNQIRSLQRKYGQKSRDSILSKGYDIKPNFTIDKYRQILVELSQVLAAHDLKIVSVPDNATMEECQTSCEKIRRLLTVQTKRLEAQAADLRRFARLMARLKSMLPDPVFVDMSSTVKIIEGVRAFLDRSLEDVRRIELEGEKLSARIEVLQDGIATLELFLERHDYFVDLWKTEQETAAKLDSIQVKRSELLKQQKNILSRLESIAASEREAENRVAAKGQLVNQYQRLIESLTEARTAELILEHQAEKITEIAEAMKRAEKGLEELQENLAPRFKYQPPVESVPNLEPLQLGSQYECPCCGTEYTDKAELEKRIKHQLAQGRYGRELQSFLIELERRSSESLRSHLLETVRSRKEEMVEAERASREQRATLNAFRRLTDQVGLSGMPSEAQLREGLQEHEDELEQLRQALSTHEANTLRKENEGIQSALADLQTDLHRNNLAQIRVEISDLTRPIADKIQLRDFHSVEAIQVQVNSMKEEVATKTAEREALLAEITKIDLPERRVRDLDEILGDLESLTLSEDAPREYTPSRQDSLTRDNLEQQIIIYKLVSLVDDISKIFGLLSAEERADLLTTSIKSHERNAARWKQCYANIESINANLSRLSHTGLQKSLDEYGPLINQIYQKFIRHDIFAGLVLKPKVSEKGRKHDLYLRLRRYSGEEEYTPASYLSEAQLNILALSIFLTRARYQRISELETIFIDDPIQQMDDMNAAAFVDVIVGLSQVGKQIIITTCDQDFYRLVSFKMRSVASAGKVSFKTLNLDRESVD
jgi:DNA repair exonuclease SbcCD ATPase subunit